LHRWLKPACTIRRTRFAASPARFALLPIISVYLLITAILYGLATLTSEWAVWQHTLIIAPLMVANITWGIIPVLQRRFHRFINPVR
jgi:antibiotic biosynthesis monooxygenase (ABM) superfamily enzyme